ncbi:hypothetical protein CGLAMM_00690 [Acetobacteraceae bacterium EV16G]
MKRSVLFDTETTGLDPATGDRVIEIAAIELIDDLPTGEVYHTLVDPERDVPPESTRVHGFTRDDLVGKPKFGEIAQGFLDFIGGINSSRIMRRLISASSMRSWLYAKNRRLIVSAWSIRWSLPKSVSPDCQIILMPCAAAIISIFPSAQPTTPYWIAASSPKSMSSLWGSSTRVGPDRDDGRRTGGEI